MKWLELLARDLDGDMPCLIVDQHIPPGVWWNEASMPFVHVSPAEFETVEFQCTATFGACAIMFEGEA